MNRETIAYVSLPTLLIAVNYYYKLTYDSFMFLLLSLSCVLLLVNSNMLIKNSVSSGLTHVLLINLALNSVYSLLNVFNLTSLMDAFIAIFLLLAVAISVSRGKTCYLSMYIPVAIITGVFLGTVVGLEYPLKYSVLGVLDISLSQLLSEEVKRGTLMTKTLTAVVLYTSPIYFTSVFTCLYNLLLFTFKILMVNEKKKLIIGLDVAFKPLVYGLKPWI